MNHKKHFTPTLLALSVAIASNAVWAQEPIKEKTITDAEAKEIKKAEEVEVIQVTGLRGSIVRSTLLKQMSNNLIDVISAEDVGNFPDTNVIESMQRVTGVQITRSESGDATGFTVRGISQNRVELNGRSVAAGEGEGRNTNLGDIPSSLIDSLEVIKSPTADMKEGSLGATVNLKTKRPLAMKDGIININAKALYGDNIEKVYPNLSAIYAKKLENTKYGDFGILFNGSYNNNEVSGDILKVNNWGNKCDAYVKDNSGLIDRASFATCGDNVYHAPDSFTQLQYENEQLRESLVTTLQWRPNDDSEYLFEATYNHKRNRQTRDTLTIANRIANNYFDADTFDQVAGDDGIYHAFENVVLAGTERDLYNEFGEVTNTVYPVASFDTNAAYINSSNGQGNQQETKLFSLALQGKWFLDTMEIEAEATYSSSEYQHHYINHALNFFSGNPLTQQNQTLRVDEGEGFLPVGNLLGIDLSGSDGVALDWQGNSTIDPTQLKLNAAQDDGYTHNPTTASFKVDVDYDLDLGDIDTLEFGIRFDRNTMERSHRFVHKCNRNNAYGANGPNNNSFEEGDFACTDPSISLTDLMEAYPDAVKIVDGFYTEPGVSSIDSWIQISQDFWFNNQEDWKEVFGYNDFGGYIDRPEEDYTLTEDSAAAYVKLNAQGELGNGFEYRGNFGVRGVYTNIDSVTTPGSTNLDGELVETTDDKNYTEWLPSLNLAVVHDFGIIRLAAAKVMVRPTFGQLKPTGTFNTFNGCNVYDPSDPYNNFGNEVPNPALSAAEQERQLAQQHLLTSGAYVSGTTCPGIRSSGTVVGSIQLDPYTSNNYDLSFEKYWGKGNSASIAFFYRQVNADIERERFIAEVGVDPATQYVGEAGSGFLEGQNISSVEGAELWRAKRWINGTQTTRRGIELSYTQFFDFLPEMWTGFGFTANYTLSKGTRPAAKFANDDGEELDFSLFGFNGLNTFEEKLAAARELEESGQISNVALVDDLAFLPVQGLARHSGNLSLFYDKGGINTRISYNYKSEFFSSGTAAAPIYTAARGQVDFAANYKINDSYTVRFNITNLTNSIKERYNGYEERLERSFYNDRVFSVGLNAKF